MSRATVSNAYNRPDQLSASLRERIIASIARAQTDIAVAYSLPDGSPALDAVRARGLPLVVVDQPVVPGSARVDVDDFGGAALAARHIASLGHRRVAILAFSLTPDGHQGPASADRVAAARFRVTRERVAGYLSALDVAEVPIWEASCGDQLLGRAGARWLLSQHPRPTALLCMSDVLALGAMDACADLDLRIPDDVSIIGFDDAPAAAWSTPPLTTIRQDLVSKGRLAGELALELLDGSRPGPATTLGVSLVPRGSTSEVAR